MVLLGLIVLLLVVRPLVRRIVTPDGMTAGGAVIASAAGSAGVAAAMSAPRTAANPGVAAVSATRNATADAAATLAATVAAEHAVHSSRTASMIDVARVQGQVHAQSVQKVGELAEQNPPEAVSIIRTWLHEEAA
jgi:flagellar M-ring protein FliF